MHDLFLYPQIAEGGLCFSVGPKTCLCFLLWFDGLDCGHRCASIHSVISEMNTCTRFTQALENILATLTHHWRRKKKPVCSLHVQTVHKYNWCTKWASSLLHTGADEYLLNHFPNVIICRFTTPRARLVDIKGVIQRWKCETGLKVVYSRVQKRKGGRSVILHKGSLTKHPIPG